MHYAFPSWSLGTRKESLVTPWFDQPGGGVQFKLGESIKELAKEDIDKGIRPKIKLIGEYN